MSERTWHDVVVECEKILGCEPGDTAESPLSSNLPNLIRDILIGSRNADEIVRLKKRLATEYDRGFREGEGKQAIIENQARDRFIADLKKRYSAINSCAVKLSKSIRECGIE